MDALKVLLTRRSVRKFTSQPVEEVVIENILRAAMAAPSAVNEQPWHFCVVKKRQILDKIPSVHPYAAMCAQAQLAIIPCVDIAQEKYRDFWVQDMAAAAQNILLAASAQGLGAVWVGVYPNKERMDGLRGLLAMPESVLPFNLIPLGYSDVSQGEAPERFKKERIHVDRW